MGITYSFLFLAANANDLGNAATDEDMQGNEVDERIRDYEDFFKELSTATEQDAPEDIVGKVVGMHDICIMDGFLC